MLHKKLNKLYEEICEGELGTAILSRSERARVEVAVEAALNKAYDLGRTEASDFYQEDHSDVDCPGCKNPPCYVDL